MRRFSFIATHSLSYPTDRLPLFNGDRRLSFDLLARSTCNGPKYNWRPYGIHNRPSGRHRFWRYRYSHE